MTSGLGSPEDRDLNDPFGLWGDAPSYRCLMTRHKACEPQGAEEGCTCSCGHQEPVCACSTREVDEDGELVHFLGCPAGPDSVQDPVVQSKMSRQREEVAHEE